MGVRETKFGRLVAHDMVAGEHIGLSAQVDPHTLTTRDGLLVQMYELKGAPFETVDELDINSRFEALNQFLLNNAVPGITLYAHLVRERTEAAIDGGFRSGFAAELDSKYQGRIRSERLYRNRLFLSVVYCSPLAAVSRRLAGLFAKASRLRAAYQQDIQEGLDVLNDAAESIQASLSRYGVRRLGVYEHEGNRFSEVQEVIGYLLNGLWQRMPLIPRDLKDVLCTSRILCGNETIEVRSAAGTRYLAALEIKEYCPTVRPGFLDGLLVRDYEFVLTQSFSPMARTDAIERLRRQRGRLVNAGDLAVSQVQEIDLAMDDLASGRLSYGHHHFTLMVSAQDLRELRLAVADGRSALADAGFVVAREDLGLEAAYWAQLPGNLAYRPRLAMLSSRNFAAMAPMHNYPTGEVKGHHWGPAVSVLETAAGGPYYFSFHSDPPDLGNTLVVGPPGSGKTVLLGFMIAQLERFSPHVGFIDKDRGGEAMVRALGGRYLPLRVGAPSGFNPFQLGEDEATEAFLVRLIERLCYREGSPPPEAQAEISAAVRTVLRDVPFEERRLGVLLEALSMGSPGGPRERIHPWVGEGRHAWLFDNATDAFSMEGTRFIGVDITEFLEDPDLRTATLMYLFERFNAWMDGRRFVLVIDEFWRALADPVFAAYVNDKLKTIRKLNGFLVAATQSVRDAIRSGIAHSIMEACPTKIFLPNESAQEEDYIEGVKLSEKELALIRTLPDRHMLIRQGTRSVVAKLDLGGLDDEIAVLSGRAAHLPHLEDALRIAGAEPAAWLPVFHDLRKGGYRHAAK